MTPDPLFQALRMYDDLVEIRRQRALVELRILSLTYGEDHGNF